MSEHQLPLPFDDSIQARFQRFDAAHPDVYAEFRALAYQMRRKRDHYGARSIIEVLRWNRLLSSSGTEHFKINDNFISRYARKLIAEDPASFASFFELRVLRSA